MKNIPSNYLNNAQVNKAIKAIYIYIHTLYWTSNFSLNVAVFLVMFSNISGSAKDYIFTDLHLHDGSLYTVGVMGCNEAGLCSPYHKYTVKVSLT